MLTEMKRHLPWWSQITVRLVFSKLPVSYNTWRKLGVFKHGFMDSSKYANSVFENHMARAGLQREHLRDTTILEIGPGDSVATAIIAKCHGAKAILLDAGHFAQDDIKAYIELCEYLRKLGLEPPDLSSASTLEDVLSVCNAKYLTEGFASYKKIPTNSVDFVFSHGVLMLIPKKEFLPTMQECRRIMKPEFGRIVHD